MCDVGPRGFLKHHDPREVPEPESSRLRMEVELAKIRYGFNSPECMEALAAQSDAQGYPDWAAMHRTGAEIFHLPEVGGR